MGNTFNLFAYGLTCNGKSHPVSLRDFSQYQIEFEFSFDYSLDTRIPVLRILTNLLVVSQNDEFKFKTFADCLNGLEINEEMELSANRLVTDGKINSQSIVDLIAESNDEEERFAVDILYRLLVGLFVQPAGQCDGKIHEHVCKTLEALIKCSARIRHIATDEKFLLQIIEQMGKVTDSIVGNWNEYARKHRNSKVKKKTKTRCRMRRSNRIYLCTPVHIISD